jgi:galactose mutarotase-like enzyme
MAENDIVTIGSGALRAQIALRGAELVRLTHAEAGDLLWQRDLRVWLGVSPILFPVVGRVRDDRIVVDGRAHAMPQHGFASTLRHELVSGTAQSCRFRLGAGDGTRAAYPFDFGLTLDYRVEGESLHLDACVGNGGGEILPAAFGFHPGLRWPLPGARDKAGHVLIFPDDAVLEVRRVSGGLLGPDVHTHPLENHRLRLSEDLFQSRAMILTGARSSEIVLAAATAPRAIAIRRSGLPHLGLWMKPGHDFLCIEPWHGYSDPVDFHGEFRDKPGLFHLAPGAERRFSMQIAVVPAP